MGAAASDPSGVQPPFTEAELHAVNDAFGDVTDPFHTQRSQTRVLVTGAASQLGAFVCLRLLKEGRAVLGIESASAITQPAPLAYPESRPPADYPQLVTQVAIANGYRGSLLFKICDSGHRRQLSALFSKFGPFDAVIHLEEPTQPQGERESGAMRVLAHSRSATVKLTSLLRVMDEHSCRTLVLGSSIAVYGECPRGAPAEEVQILRIVRHGDPRREDIVLSPRPGCGTYGRTKLACEQLCLDVVLSDGNRGEIPLDGSVAKDAKSFKNRWRIICARLGVVAGAHPSGAVPLGVKEGAVEVDGMETFSNRFVHLAYAASRVGREGSGIPILVPKNGPPIPSSSSKGSAGELPSPKSIQAKEAPQSSSTTGEPDGTAVRDYLHVSDAAEGIAYCLRGLLVRDPGWYAYNICTGVGHSILDIVRAAEKVSGKQLMPLVVTHYPGPYISPGETDVTLASPTAAAMDLGWKPKFNVDHILIHTMSQVLGIGDQELRVQMTPKGAGTSNEFEDVALSDTAADVKSEFIQKESTTRAIQRMLEHWEIGLAMDEESNTDDTETEVKLALRSASPIKPNALMNTTSPGVPTMPRKTKIRRPADPRSIPPIPTSQSKPAPILQGDDPNADSASAPAAKRTAPVVSSEARPPPQVYRRVSNGVPVPGLTLERREERPFALDYSNRLNSSASDDNREGSEELEANTIPSRRGANSKPSDAEATNEQKDKDPVLSSRRYQAQDSAEDAADISVGAAAESQSKSETQASPLDKTQMPVSSNPFEAIIERTNSGNSDTGADSKQAEGEDDKGEAAEVESVRDPV